jgi:hypothetical protein
VPLDKSEGVVKTQVWLAVFFAPRDRQSGGGPKLCISHGESLFGEVVPPTIDTA